MSDLDGREVARRYTKLDRLAKDLARASTRRS